MDTEKQIAAFEAGARTLFHWQQDRDFGIHTSVNGGARKISPKQTQSDSVISKR
jgi:hypothetical protein